MSRRSRTISTSSAGMWALTLLRKAAEMRARVSARPRPLPAIHDRGRVLGPVGLALPVEARDRDDLPGRCGVKRDEREAVHAVHVGEVPRPPVGELRLGAERSAAGPSGR
jgi:hypothetical protein